MRLVSWNCQERFEDKFKVLDDVFHADIYVICECWNPSKSENAEFLEFAKGSLWVRDEEKGANKGLGIFHKPWIKIEDNKWDDGGNKLFISCRVNDKFDLLGVWTRMPRMIKEFYDYLQLNKDKFTSDMILAGDFNSNTNWDEKNGRKSHTNTIKQLAELGLCSAYHYQHKEEHGKESVPTYYQGRHIDEPYHIDFCFLNPSRLAYMEVGKYDVWSGKRDKNPVASDHMPLVIDFV